MPYYLLHLETLKTIWPIILISTIAALAVALLTKDSQNKKEAFIITISFCSLGIVTGFLSGLSRQPVLAAVLPSVLSMIGGVLLVVVSKDNTNKNLVGTSIFFFSIMILIGTCWGAVSRNYAEFNEQHLDHGAEIIRLKKQALIEYEVNRYRSTLGLQPLLKKKNQNTSKDSK